MLLGCVGDRLVDREATQGVGLDLAHALARDPELLADLLERSRLAPAETKAQRDDVALAFGQLRDRAPHGVAADGLVDLVLGRRAGCGEQVAEARVSLRADRCVGRGDRARSRTYLDHLIERQLRLLCDLLH